MTLISIYTTDLNNIIPKGFVNSLFIIDDIILLNLTYETYLLAITLFTCPNFDITTYCPIIYKLCCAFVILFRPAVSVGKDILFCNFWGSVGWYELQMCMAFSVGYSFLSLHFRGNLICSW